MPSLIINKWGPMEIYRDYTMKEQIGTWYHKELAVDGDFGYGKSSMAYTSKLGWTSCFIPDGENAGNKVNAYSPDFAEGVDFTKGTKYAFLVRRKCRIFDTLGKNVITNLYAGDFILTDGHSDAGKAHPDLLSINGYIKDGSTHHLENNWCDTDINIGYSSNPTVYGIWSSLD